MVSQRPPLRGIALTLGAISVLAVAAGAAMLLLAPPEQGSTGGGALIRVGAVLAAAALVLPSIRKPSLPRLILAAGGLLLVLARPGLVWAVGLGLAVAWFARRQRSTADRDS